MNTLFRMKHSKFVGSLNRVSYLNHYYYLIIEPSSSIVLQNKRQISDYYTFRTAGTHLSQLVSYRCERSTKHQQTLDMLPPKFSACPTLMSAFAGTGGNGEILYLKGIVIVVAYKRKSRGGRLKGAHRSSIYSASLAWRSQRTDAYPGIVSESGYPQREIV